MERIIEMSEKLKENWQDVNGVFAMPSDFSINWLWKEYNKEVSFNDCYQAWRIAIRN